MKVSIRLARKSDIKAYSDMLQRTYQAVYTDKKIGLTKDCFSKEVFSSQRCQEYLKFNLVVNTKQKAWLAFLGSKLIGSITVSNLGSECELRGFYVDVEFHGRGIGRKLWEKALTFAQDKDIVLEVYEHSTRAVEMYKKWGFKIDKQKEPFYRHWPEWPEGVRAKCIYMRFSLEK